MQKAFLIILLLTSSLLSSCNNTVERLSRIGKQPDLANVEIPELEEDADSLESKNAKLSAHQMHMRTTNSLWQPGSTQFFRDSRAWKIGDLIRVVVQIADNASLSNGTQQKRSGSDSMAIPNLFGKEKVISTLFSKTGDPNSLIKTNSSRNQSGNGSISRTEAINTEIAAIVTKVLPNGNLVIEGSQEVRVNYELREIKVAGIIRPKDISVDNAVNTNQIAEARISYGGRGVISDVQQPRAGAQIIDIVSPF